MSRPASAGGTSASRGLGAAHRRRISTERASAPAPVETLEPETTDQVDLDSPWVVIVWNDPINLMSYVAFVFRKLFGYSKEEAERLMLQVHHEGRAVVSSGDRQEAERDVFRLHEHGLWATMQQD